ncbi:flavin-containing monooxygenase [Intrasporangium oryzae]|uniref:flavin-containing monooxygenase n=1 Tax=Intrasporangium oryzae TaxID=412687 RepID=UPI000550AF60|nr:NAD(P)/FAD-dependent oxidoreductase [Intrasporangium oryzae]
MAEEIDVVVIGAGQAGLATSHELTVRGVEHVVLEERTPGSSWAGRWDSFTLVGPNHLLRLPGGAYDGDDPDGFMGRSEIVAHLERYAAGLAAEVRNGTPVRALGRGPGGVGFLLDTDDGPIRSRVVVVATGAYQQPTRPVALAGLPPGTAFVDVAGYRNPAQLPDGSVIVVGSGQSACQIAEELALAGRDVVMACGRAPWFHRRLAGRDLFEWLLDSPFFEQRTEDLPSPAARHGANVQASGLDGGHDLHYRTLAGLGVRLGGRVAAVDDGAVRLAPDLRDSLAFGDAGYRRIRDLLVEGCHATGREVPEVPEPAAFDPAPVERVPLRGIGAVVAATGFRSRYTEWIDVPGLVDEQGFPVHADGESAVAPGLHFVGVHFLRRRRSSLLFGVGDDAAATAELIVDGLSTA